MSLIQRDLHKHRREEREIKERRFVAYYLTNGYHGTNAAIQAGYSPRSARTIAWRLKRKPHIAEAIRQDKIAMLEKWYQERIGNTDPYELVKRMLNRR